MLLGVMQQQLMVDSSSPLPHCFILTSHSVFMSFDSELLLTGWHRPQLDQPTPGPGSQGASPGGKLTRCAWPVIGNFTTLICHLQPVMKVMVLIRLAWVQVDGPALA